MPNREAALELVVEKAYAAALDDELWPCFLSSAADLFGAVGVSFELHDKKLKKPLMLELSAELPQDEAPEYMAYYAGISPRVKHGLSIPSGHVSYDYAILTESEMDADEFYSDFHKQHGLRYFVAGNLVNSASHYGAFAAQRSPQRGHVDDDEIAVMQRLIPHVSRAVDLRFRLNQSQMLQQSLMDCLEMLEEAAMVLDQSGNVVYVNGIASEMFLANDGIGIFDKRIKLEDRSAAKSLAFALNKGGKDTSGTAVKDIVDFVSRRPSGKRPYIVTVRALPEPGQTHIPISDTISTIVFVRDPAVFVRLDTELLKQSYQLTRAELDIAVSLHNGISIRHLAEQRGVSITTVRSQLYSLMRKMDVSRQPDLLRLLDRYRRPFT